MIGYYEKSVKSQSIEIKEYSATCPNLGSFGSTYIRTLQFFYFF